MKVYVVTKGYEHEGDSPVRVFKTKESAQKFCDKKDKETSVRGYLDAYYEVEEFELEE